MQRSVEGLRVTPWADWSEWCELKEMLTSGNVAKANERFQAYLIRRRQAVPVAMVSTISLRYQLEYPSPDEYSQRLGLAMALVRFVNGMTDRLQPRGEGAFAKSVHSLSVELKLPLILVEIRHQASHNTLPRLTALESGARKALEWLEEYYWSAQYQKIQHYLDNSPRGLKHIFARQNESEDFSLDTALGTDETQAYGAFVGTSDDSFVLQRLKVLSKGIAEGTRNRTQAVGTNSEHLQSSGEQWAECKNYEEWKTTAIGLIPGQKRAPRWPAESTEGSNDAGDSAVVHETSSLNATGIHIQTDLSPVEPLRKRVNRLSTRDEENVTEMTLHYEKLLKPYAIN